ncbi:MAG: glycosyltransferase [Bacteroidetes bacterium]|nr:glycosyltransferase [Bacteroidota bacterium]
MKILFFIESLYAGGKERRLVELLKILSKNFKLNLAVVITKKDIHYKEVLDLPIEIHIIERKHFKKDPGLFFKFFKIMKKFEPDIIHVWGNMAALYAIPAKIILRKKMINSQITAAPKIFKGSLLNHITTFFFSNVIISNSHAGIISYNAPKEKSIVINNGFDFSRIAKLEAPDKIRKRLSITTKFVVGMVATFCELKDYTTYIKAALTIVKTRTDISFLCIGSGDSSQYQKMVPNEFKRKILFLGKQENVESIMNICYMGVLTTYTEGIPNTIMEFMALSKPVIVTNGGGSKELVLDKKNGFLISLSNPDELTEKITFLLDNSDEAIKLGNKGQIRINNEFGIEKMVNSFYKLYQDLCAE